MRVVTGGSSDPTAYVEANETMGPDELLGAMRKLARAYHDITGAMPPALSRKQLGLDPDARKALSPAARAGHRNWRAAKLKLVKGEKR